MLDVFNTDIFGVVSLTDSINMLPYQPARIGQMGLFTPTPVATTTALIEERHGKLSLLQTSARGTAGNTTSRAERKARSFLIPHIASEDAVIADEVQGVRAFGSEDTTEVFTTVVNDKLAQHRQDHEVTHEYHRAGCLNGEVLDADNTSILNLFTEFGLTEKTFSFATEFSTGTNDGDLKQLCTDVIRYIRDALGASSYSFIHAMCDDNFFDNLIKHPEVRESYKEFQNNEFARTIQGGQDGFVFTWGGIRWENYRGKIGDRDFIAADTARFFPVGVPGLFRTYYAPADYIETVNTLGRPFYAKQTPMKFDKGIELETQTNPLHICTRPQVLVKGVGV